MRAKLLKFSVRLGVLLILAALGILSGTMLNVAIPSGVAVAGHCEYDVCLLTGYYDPPYEEENMQYVCAYGTTPWDCTMKRRFEPSPEPFITITGSAPASTTSSRRTCLVPCTISGRRSLPSPTGNACEFRPSVIAATRSEVLRNRMVASFSNGWLARKGGSRPKL